VGKFPYISANAAEELAVTEALGEGFAVSVVGDNWGRWCALIPPSALPPRLARVAGGWRVAVGSNNPAPHTVYRTDVRAARRQGDRREPVAIAEETMGLLADNRQSEISADSEWKYARAWNGPGPGDPFLAYQELHEVAAYGPFEGEVFDTGTFYSDIQGSNCWLFDGGEVAIVRNDYDETWTVYSRYEPDGDS
jgi:hypothetical protein